MPPEKGKGKGKKEKKAKKVKCIETLYERFGQYKQIIICSILSVGTPQIQNIRTLLRKSKSTLVILKNSVIRKALELRTTKLPDDSPFSEKLKKLGDAIPDLAKIIEQLQGKIALIFTDQPASELKDLIEGNKIPKPAKIGVPAQCDVIVPEGTTGLDPGQVGFFHALQISTKIVNGQIQITKPVKICDKGKPVSTSASALLKKLDIKPFAYGIEIKAVYDSGSIIGPEMLKLTSSDILERFQKGLSYFKALSLEGGFVNEATIPTMISTAFKNIAAISMVSDYKIKELGDLKEGEPKKPKEKKENSKKEEKPKDDKKPAPVKEPEPTPAVVEDDMNIGGMFD